MEINNISKLRGLTSIYNGQYIIYSSCYGVVAYSTKINRSIDSKVKIDFVVLNAQGWYWNLQAAISRGVKKIEQQFVNKDVKITFKTVEKAELDKKYLKVEFVDRQEETK